MLCIACSLNIIPMPEVLAQSVVDTTANTSPAFIRLEIKKNPFPDSVEIYFWEDLVDVSSDIPSAQRRNVPLRPGTMYEGSLEAMVLDWNSPSIKDRAFLTLRNGRYQLLDKFMVEPGDSVRIGFDLERGITLFAGPSADKFRIQSEIQKAMEEQKFSNDIPMFTSTAEFWKGSPKDSISYFRAINQKSSAHRAVFPLAGSGDKASYMENQLSRPLSNNEGWRILDSYKSRLSADFLDLLSTQMMGQLLYEPMDSFRKSFEENDEFMDLFEMYVTNRDDSIPVNAAASPQYMDYLYSKNVVISAVNKIPFRNLLTYEDQKINEMLEAKFIFQNFRWFSDSNTQFEKTLDRVEDPYLTGLLDKVYRSQRIGAPVSDFPLTDMEGKQVGLNKHQGRFILLSFWLPGCSASESAFENRVSAVEKHFSRNNDLEVVYISSAKDHERWQTLVNQGKYSSPDATNYRAAWKEGSFLEFYNIRSFPAMMLIDPEGNMINNGNFLYTKDGLIAYLEETIEQYHSEKP